MLEGKGEIGGSVKVEEIECGMKTWAETIQGRIESASFGIDVCVVSLGGNSGGTR